MGALAIHQFQQVTTDDPTDVLAAVRTSGVSPENIQIPRSKIGMELIVSPAILIPSADVLTLNSTPVELLEGVTGKMIVPMQLLMELSGASTNYATNIQAIAGTESAISDTNFTLTGSLPTMANATMCFPGYSNAGQITGMVGGDGLFLSVMTGNPTTGDGDVVCTVIYQLWDA